MVSVATWNINSVRLRIEQVMRFLTEQAPDVLCLQEIKVAEHLFPTIRSKSWDMSTGPCTGRKAITASPR
jgi:exonuclease III